MTRTRPVLAALAALLLVAAGADDAFAQKGRSYSGGGGRSSPAPAGRSYSSGGGKSTPSVSPPRTSPSPPRQTPAPSLPSPGGKTSPSAGAPSRPPASSATPKPEGRTYAGGSGGAASGGTKPAPGTSGYDASAGQAQRRVESRDAYKGAQPKTTYRDRTGQERPLDPGDVRVDEVRRRTTPWQWEHREERRRQVYIPPPYYGPVIVYRDPYSDWFWWWMVTQSLDQRAMWAYHHHSVMDEERYRDLLRRDQALEAKVRELEAKNVARDPKYTPSGLDSDLMYTDDYVGSAYNPQAAPPGKTVVLPRPAPRPGYGQKLFTVFVVVLLLGFVVWLIFIKRWDVG